MNKQTALYLLIIFLNFSCSSKEKRKILSTFPSGKTKMEIIYLDNDDTSNYQQIKYFENGKIESSIDFSNGRFNGKIIDYYENDQKKFEGLTKMGYFINTKISYFENGKVSQIDSLFEECKATNCCCDGVITKYYENGKLKERSILKSGLFNGEVRQYFENGKLAAVRYFIDDKEHGTSRYWTKNGNLEKEKTYKFDIVDGPTTEYYDSYKIYGNYVNGKEEGEWLYIDTTDKVIRTDIYRNGILTKTIK